MKPFNLILIAGLAGGLFGATAAKSANAPATNGAPADAVAGSTNETAKAPAPSEAAPAGQAPEPAPAPAEQTAAPGQVVSVPPDLAASAPDTNTIVDANGDIKLRMNFRNVPLETVLKYMSSAAGYIIHPKVDVRGNVTVWSEQPLSRDEALTLLKQMLNENGYTALQEGENDRILTIISSSQARHEDIPVKEGNTPANIPKNTQIVTQIIPVRSLNAVSLIKDLQPLLPADTTLTANESGNALVMTDTQANIHRIAEIVRALDSVSSSSSTIIVFPLKFADAKTVAGLIKDLFPTSTASGSSSSGGGGFFGRFRRGGIPGLDGGDSGGGSDTGNGHTPTSRVTAVSDDHSNSLVVSAPDDLIPTIKELVASIDTDVLDTTVVQVFALKNADANEMATVLNNLFPDDSKTDENNNNNFSSSGRFRFGGFFGGGSQPQQNNNSSSDRMKRMNRVLAVPDPRTASLVVSASKDLMPQIGAMIERLDANPRRKMIVYSYALQHAEAADVLPVLQDLFPTGNTSRNSSTSTALQQNALTTRGQSMQTQQNSGTGSSFGTVGGGGRSFGQ